MIMGFGTITQQDIAQEIAARGVTVQALTVDPGNGLGPPPVLELPEGPEEPITILPLPPIPPPPPLIPIFPPLTVIPEDVNGEEIVPYIPGTTEPTEKKGMDKGLLILIGITAFALMTLAKPKTQPRAQTPRRTPRRYDRRSSFTRRRRRF